MKNKFVMLMLGLGLSLGLSACNSNQVENTNDGGLKTKNEEVAVEDDSKKEADPEKKTYEDSETDVLVIGGGAAGLAAGISANENGADVIVVERQAKTGGSLTYSGGAIGATNTRFQRELGIEDSKESWMDLWKERQNTGRKSDKYPEYDFVDYFMDEAVVTTEWLADYTDYEYVDVIGFGTDPVRRLHVQEVGEGQSRGALMADHLLSFMLDKGVDLRLKNRANELIVDDKGDVVGAKIEVENKDKSTYTYNIKAKKVILAAGGFAKNEEMLNRFIPELEDSSELSLAAPGSMGDGIKMAEEVGASLHDENWFLGLGITSKYPKEQSLMFDWTKLYVDGNGNRFTNEAVHYSIASNEVLEADTPWAVFDSNDTNKDLIGILSEDGPEGEYVKADSLEELAEKMGADQNNLLATINSYNEAKETNQDAFGKDSEFISPLVTAPFHAVKIYPVTMGTFGGVRVNKDFEVLNEGGESINNLYATGECANKTMYNQVYMSGSAVQFALTSGRIAGERAAKSIN